MKRIKSAFYMVQHKADSHYPEHHMLTCTKNLTMTTTSEKSAEIFNKKGWVMQKK